MSDENYQHEMALCQAVEDEDLDEIRRLSKISRIPMDGFWLCLAAQAGKTEIVRLFIEELAYDPSLSDRHGTALIDYAACEGHLEIVQMLLKNGANPNGTFEDYAGPEFNWTPEEVEAEFALCGEDNQTTLQKATEAGWPEVVEVLLNAGANLRGQTPDFYRQRAQSQKPERERERREWKEKNRRETQEQKHPLNHVCGSTIILLIFFLPMLLIGELFNLAKNSLPPKSSK